MFKGNIELLKGKSVEHSKDLYLVGTSEDLKSLEQALSTGAQSKDITVLTTLPLSNFLNTVAYGVSDIIKLESWNVTELQLRHKLDADKTFQNSTLFYSLKEKAENQELTNIEVINLLRLYVSTSDPHWFKCLTNKRNYKKFIDISNNMASAGADGSGKDELVESLKQAIKNEQENSKKIISEKENQIKMLENAISVGSKEFDRLEKELAEAKQNSGAVSGEGSSDSELVAALESKKAELSAVQAELQEALSNLEALKETNENLSKLNEKLLNEDKSAELEETRKNLETANEEITVLKGKLSELEQGFEPQDVKDLKDKLLEAEVCNQSLRDKVTSLQEKLKENPLSMRDKIAATAMSQTVHLDAVAGYENKIRENEENYAQLKEKYDDVVYKLHIKEDEISSLQERMSRVTKSIGTSEHNAQATEEVEEAKDIDAIEENVEVKNTGAEELEAVQCELEEIQIKLSREKERSEILNESLTDLEEDYNEKVNEYEELLKENSKLEEQVESLSTQVAELMAELEELRKKEADEGETVDKADEADADEYDDPLAEIGSATTSFFGAFGDEEKTAEESEDKESEFDYPDMVLPEESDEEDNEDTKSESSLENELQQKQLELEAKDEKIVELENANVELQEQIHELEAKVEEALKPADGDSPEVANLKAQVEELITALQQRENDYAALAPMIFDEKESADNKSVSVNDFDGILPVIMNKQALTAKNIITLKEVGSIPYLEDIVVYLTAKLTLALKDYGVKPCVVILDPLTDKNRVERYKRMGIAINEEPHFNNTPVSMLGVTNTLSYIDLKQKYNLNSYKLILFVDRYAGTKEYVSRDDITRFSITPTADYCSQVKTDTEHTLLTYKEDGNPNSLDIPTSFIKGDSKTRIAYLSQEKAYAKVITEIIDSLII